MIKTSRVHQKIRMVVETIDRDLWGRCIVKSNLIVDSAKSLEALKKQMKKLVYDLEAVEVPEFEISYDLTSFFHEYSYLNISEVAQRAGINPGLMRQYVAGIKFPSEIRVKKIEKAVREIGKQLSKIRLHKPVRMSA